MKVLVTGARGMLGGEVCDALASEHEARGVDIEDFDLTDAAATRAALSDERPSLVIHCAAWTDVDGCERDPERAFRQNAQGSWNLAAACAQVGAGVVYISTDFVFDGEKGEAYTEFDLPNPLNAYGASKLAGENAVRRLVASSYVVRSAWLFGHRGRNFVRAILEAAREKDEIRVVSDQIGSPTYARDLAEAIVRLIVSGPLTPGTYHLVNEGSCAWSELASEALRIAGLPARVRPIPSSEWPSPTRRPACSALRSRWLELQGVGGLRPWKEALASYLEDLA